MKVKFEPGRCYHSHNKNQGFSEIEFVFVVLRVGVLIGFDLGIEIFVLEGGGTFPAGAKKLIFPHYWIWDNARELV